MLYLVFLMNFRIDQNLTFKRADNVPFSKFQRRDRSRADPKIHRNNQNTFKKQMKNQNEENIRIIQRRKDVDLKIFSSPENQYNLPPTRAACE
jgi:hypothetical protein